ncbi:hypothetical protein [Caulobacter mirabilis]|uniref:Uncharacterized protein n=1 Tax=Caulobacter mirabilis TaxID=69666 RepID=A0A2D2AZI5_9CAUL|nr:hypothetical protein [Caulobacter mirabilis]ATQ43428.1 hypothetical protein CSW64_13900 [Caulobacter mirabilis]
MEARLNAPLPLDVMTFLLKRLEPWRPGTPGRYAAIYARRADVEGGASATAYLDGRPIPVRFLSAERQREQLKLLGAVAGGTTILVFLLVISTASVLSTRSEATLRLEQLEQTTQRRLVEVRRREALAAQVQALEAADLEPLRASAVLSDLDWAAGALAPEVSLEAVYREGALLAVEVRGDQTPFAAADRTVQRSDAQVRRGVWLWGVTASPPPAEIQP